MSKIMKRHRGLWILAVLTGLCISVINVGFSYTTGRIIDSIDTGTVSDLMQIGVRALLLLLAYIIAGNLYTYFSAEYDTRVAKDTKKTILESLFRRPIYSYQEKDESWYYNLLTQDMEQILENYVSLTYGTVVSFGGLIVSLIALFTIHIPMTLIFIGIMFVVTLVPRLFVNLQTEAAGNFSDNYEGYVEELENTLSGFESVKLLNIGRAVFDKITGRDRSMEEARKKKELVNGFSVYIITGVSFFSQVACMFIGAYFAMTGQITTGMLLMAVQLLNFVFPPIREISTNRNLMKANETIRKKAAPYLEPCETKGRPYRQGDIVLDDFGVTLGGRPVLEHLDLDFEPGNSYVVIGPSGSGKSTLAKAVAGYYKDYEGSLRYGDREAADVDPSSLPEHIRYIGTDAFVLNDSIAENIRMYRDIEKDDIYDVAETVGFDKDFVDKEEIGHSGKYISSGEYQRINIARALLEEPYVLIFDEPTANLDPENTESVKKLIASLDVPIKIVITHDYDDEYLQAFDRVIDFHHIGRYQRKEQ